MVCLAVSVFYKYVVAISQILLCLFLSEQSDLRLTTLAAVWFFLVWVPGRVGGWRGVKWLLTKVLFPRQFREGTLSENSIDMGGGGWLISHILQTIQNSSNFSFYNKPLFFLKINHLFKRGSKVFKTFLNIGFHLWPGYQSVCVWCSWRRKKGAFLPYLY